MEETTSSDTPKEQESKGLTVSPQINPFAPKDVQSSNALEKKEESPLGVLFNVSINNGLSEEGQRLYDRFQALCDQVVDPNRDFGEKMDIIAQLHGMIGPQVYKEMHKPAPNTDKSTVGKATTSIVDALAKSFLVKKQYQASDDLNPNSVKFKTMIDWFWEMVNASLYEQGADPVFVQGFFRNIAYKTVGWEERLTKALKGVSGKALEMTSNPFLADMQRIVNEGNLPDDPGENK